MTISEDTFDRLTATLDDAAAALSDEQVLLLADRLHEELRRRRDLRGRHRVRMEHRRPPESPHW